VRAIQPYVWISAIFLFLSYVVGSWFTLRTHAALIWQVIPIAHAVNPSTAHIGTSGADGSRAFARYNEGNPPQGYDSRSPASVRDTQLYKRILGQSLNSVGLRQDGGVLSSPQGTVHRVPPRSQGDGLTPVPESPENGPRQGAGDISELANEENARLVRGVAEMAAAAATAAVQDAQRQSGRRMAAASKPSLPTHSVLDEDVPVGGEAADAAGGHDAPNWGRAKSSIILLGATVLYAVVAEILVNTVDVVLENFEIDEKFLGFTLFALVPNTTEFLVGLCYSALLDVLC
jgi:Ca2+:H+ antiporter